PIVGNPHRVRVRPVDRVPRLQGVALLDREHVSEDLADRPFTRARRLVEQGSRKASQQTAQPAECMLGQREDAARFGMRARRHAHVDFLRILERPVERVPDVHRSAAKRPRAPQHVLVECPASSQCRVEVAHVPFLLIADRSPRSPPSDHPPDSPGDAAPWSTPSQGDGSGMTRSRGACYDARSGGAPSSETTRPNPPRIKRSLSACTGPGYCRLSPCSCCSAPAWPPPRPCCGSG